MRERSYTTLCGDIHYWVGGVEDGRTLVFLPGLTADHRLFEKQLDCFAETCRVLVWDPPGHGASWPFQLSFHLMDQAEWLDAILEREGVHAPVLVGQSMGGYVGQAYTQRYPGKLGGFVAIDSAPLQRKYVTGAELWLLKRMEPVYRFWPWKWLLSAGSRGVSVTEYGQTLMREMMLVYQGDQVRYARLAGHGFRMLAEAMDGIYGVRITKHERLADDVFQTTFENGNYVIVNYSDKDYTANGQTVKATDFVKGKAVGANGN